MAQGPWQAVPLGGCGQPAPSPAPHAPDQPLHLQPYLPASQWFPRGSAPPWASAKTTAALRSQRSSSVSLFQNWSRGNRRCVRGGCAGRTGHMARSALTAASGVCGDGAETVSGPGLRVH